MNPIFATEPDREPVLLGRRSFLKTTAAAAAGLTIGFRWAGPPRGALAATAGEFAPNAFLRVASDTPQAGGAAGSAGAPDGRCRRRARVGGEVAQRRL
jgi:hypothetical protein